MGRQLAVLIMLAAAFSGCAIKPADPVPSTASVTPKAESHDDSPYLALQARQQKDRLYLRFSQDNQVISAQAVIPEFSEYYGSGASTTLTLEQAVRQHQGMPVSPLLLEPQSSEPLPGNGAPLPVASISQWEDFRDHLCKSITPTEKGKGVVIDFMRQEDLFFYFDDDNVLQAVPSHEKPADVTTESIHGFEELLGLTAVELKTYMPPNAPPHADALLFNTGDSSAYGFPFVYANSRTGQISFLQRMPVEGEAPPRPGESAKAEAVMHGTASQIGGAVMQPVGTIGRLLGLLTYKAADTLTQKPVSILDDTPVPPVGNNPPMDTTLWEQTLDEMTHLPTSQGSIHYLVDGEAFFARLIDSIQSARESIDIRLYIFDNDDYAVKIADLLRKRSKEVRVRVLIDGLGTIAASSARSASAPETYQPPASIIDYLQKDSDIEVRVLLNPWLAGDHTKTIIIDEKIGFLGGMNIGREYRYDWHDLMVELQGPVVDVLRDEFERGWLREGLFGDIRANLYKPGAPKNRPQHDDIPIRVLLTMPSDSQILYTQLEAIRRAQKHIYIENAYFTSDAMIYELAKARRRGVDVRVIIPYQGDSDVINRSNIRAANTMLAHGIRIYIYPGTSHMKGAVYDGWLCLGSANFDSLSLRVNRELNIATSDAKAVQQFMDEVITPDLEKSIELEQPFPENWSDFLMEMLADHL